MNPSEEPTSKLDPSPARRDGIHLEAHASDESSIYQAGGDQNFHYVDGIHDRLRTESGNLVRECPYPGLAAFGPAQTKWFFGRDKLITELTARLDRRQRTGGIQMVVAPSGAGKSSLLRAGLLPKLDQAALPGSDHWPKLVLTPTATPIWTLATHIAARTGTRPDVVTGQLAADPCRCLSTLLPAPRGQSRIVLVVDQFEELFTLCNDERQRHAFIALLTRIAAGGPDASTEPWDWSSWACERISMPRASITRSCGRRCRMLRWSSDRCRSQNCAKRSSIPPGKWA